MLRNNTAANGIAEWAPEAASQKPPAVKGRVRAFQSFGSEAMASCKIAEVPYAEGGLGSKVWESSLALACWALMNPELVAGKNVLELGSGCGLGGIMLSAAGASKVTLTDFHGEHEQFVVKADGTLKSARLREGTGLYSVNQGVYTDETGQASFPLLRNLRENIQRNSGNQAPKDLESSRDLPRELEMATLDWSNTRDDLGTFDLVVGSDCIYAGSFPFMHFNSTEIVTVRYGSRWRL